MTFANIFRNTVPFFCFFILKTFSDNRGGNLLDERSSQDLGNIFSVIFREINQSYDLQKNVFALIFYIFFAF